MKIALSVVAVALGLGLAPLASADTAPPIAPGPHHFGWARGGFDFTVGYDCGPDCFSFDDHQGSHDLYRFDGGRWVAEDGTFTVDGITFTNTHGVSGIAS